MFSRETLARVIDLQQRSYDLLTWMNDALKKGNLRFTTAHGAISLPSAAQEWLERHLLNIPEAARPDLKDLGAFAHIFSSYLATSFSVTEKPRRVSSDGCYCEWCTYVLSLPHLKVRSPGPKARRDASRLKRLLLESLGAALGDRVPTSVLDALLSDRELAEDISYATYARELLRRAEFASQGEGVLVLWREIAWTPEGRPKKKFKLSADRALQAEAAIVRALREAKPRAIQN